MMCSLLNQTMANIRKGKGPGITSPFYSEDARRKLVTSLVQLEREKLNQAMARNERGTIHSVEQLMLCPICNAVSVEPITLPCGHTFCNFCIRDEFSSPFCGVCQSVGIDETQAVNFLLCNVIAKWFPSQVHLHKIKTTAQKMIQRNKYLEALNRLDTAQEETMKLDANYHCLRGNCNFGLGNLNLALQDIEIAAKLSPFAVHILYRKAHMLVELGDNLNALSVYIRLSALQPNNMKLKQDLETSLNNLLHVDLTSLKETMKQSLPTSVKNPGSTSEHFVDKRLLDLPASSSSEDAVTHNVNNVRSSGEQSMASLSNSKLHKSSKLNDTSQLLQIGADEFDCKLCCSLLFKPVTSPCGHTFCDECLRRSLDFRVDCPCCRTPLTKYLAERRNNVTVVVEDIIKALLPREYQTRKENFEKELKSMQSVGKSPEFEVPIFVCTLAFPSVPCPLHIFEPRYKLMIRRCVESGSRQFGMCAPSPTNDNEPCAAIGTMLKISDVAYLPDGRSLINTEGVRRFQIISREMKDGYCVAKVKWLDDEKVTSEEEESEIMKLNVNGYKLLEFWFNNMSSEQKECIVNAIGEIPMPENLQSISSDQPHWLWWALAALPLMDKPKLIILSMTSVLERLRSLWRFLMIMIKMQGKNATKEK